MFQRELFDSQGKLAQAEPLVVEALRARRTVLGEEHPDTLTSMITLAGLFQSRCWQDGVFEALLCYQLYGEPDCGHEAAFQQREGAAADELRFCKPRGTWSA